MIEAGFLRPKTNDLPSFRLPFPKELGFYKLAKPFIPRLASRLVLGAGVILAPLAAAVI